MCLHTRLIVFMIIFLSFESMNYAIADSYYREPTEKEMVAAICDYISNNTNPSDYIRLAISQALGYQQNYKFDKVNCYFERDLFMPSISNALSGKDQLVFAGTMRNGIIIKKLECGSVPMPNKEKYPSMSGSLCVFGLSISFEHTNGDSDFYNAYIKSMDAFILSKIGLGWILTGIFIKYNGWQYMITLNSRRAG